MVRAFLNQLMKLRAILVKGVRDCVDTLEMEQIYDKYHDSVYRLAFTYCKNRADAEDITSEVFLKRFEHRKPFADERHETAWMMRVTINRAKDLFRNNRPCWDAMVRRNMAKDVSWEKSAKQYLELYLEVKGS